MAAQTEATCAAEQIDDFMFQILMLQRGNMLGEGYLRHTRREGLS